MEYSIIQIALVFVVTFIAAIDQLTSSSLSISPSSPAPSSVLSLATLTPVFSWVVPISS